MTFLQFKSKAAVAAMVLHIYALNGIAIAFAQSGTADNGAPTQEQELLHDFGLSLQYGRELPFSLGVALTIFDVAQFDYSVNGQSSAFSLNSFFPIIKRTKGITPFFGLGLTWLNAQSADYASGSYSTLPGSRGAINLSIGGEWQFHRFLSISGGLELEVTSPSATYLLPYLSFSAFLF